MADLVVTPANVRPDEKGVTLEVVQANEAISEGEWVYLNQGRALRAINNTTDAAAVVRGVALTNAAAEGEWIVIQRAGRWKPGATVVAGNDYYLSSTPGGMMPDADKAAGMRIVELFYADTTSTGTINIRNTGITA